MCVLIDFSDRPIPYPHLLHHEHAVYAVAVTPEVYAIVAADATAVAVAVVVVVALAAAVVLSGVEYRRLQISIP